MKKRDLALGALGILGGAVAIKMLTRARTVRWDDVSQSIAHAGIPDLLRLTA